MLGIKTAAAGATAVSLVTLMTGMSVYFKRQPLSNDIMDVMNSEKGQVSGRVVSVPVQDYKEAFKLTLKLGQCPYIMEGGTIKKCTDKFTGKEVFLAKAETVVDVSRVQSSEDIILHIMGGLGTSVGVLGLASVSVKAKVAVTTETKKENMNLISSYHMNKGVLTLHNPRPVSVIGDSALYLSEIELGGNELFLVTLEFESVKTKTEVELSVTFKVLFISITAKLKFAHEKLKVKAKVRMQFKSSWREDKEKYFDNLGQALPAVEEMEKMYMQGPRLLRELSIDNEKTHNFYYFSSWKQTPYGSGLNEALINHDIDFLTQQNTEIKAVIRKINSIKNKSWSSDQRRDIVRLNQTVTDIGEKLSNGLENYHKLTPDGRQKLREVYGEDKAPLYYDRQLNKILG